MSRIQKAIERASQMRDQTTARNEVPAREAVNVSPIDPPPVRKSHPDTAFPEVEQRHLKNPLLVAALDEKSVAKEQFRKIKSEILVKTQSGLKGKTFLITSSVAGEGKSLTACNLAVTLSQEYDHTVLLIDADFRRPRVHSVFELPQSDGLIQCLHGEKTVDECIQHAGIGKLSILQSGGVAEDPVELLSSSTMRTILEQMKNRYPDRMIIIDCSPALLFADARALSTLVDGILYVARERVVRPGQVRDGLQLLKDAPIMGVIYNGSEENHMSNYSSYY